MSAWPGYGEKCGIYAIENTLNGKCYIGQAQDIRARWHKHLLELRGSRHGNKHLQRAWTKYGEDAFRFVVLEECDVDALTEREKDWIDTLNTTKDGYNARRASNAARGWTQEKKTPTIPRLDDILVRNIRLAAPVSKETLPDSSQPYAGAGAASIARAQVCDILGKRRNAVLTRLDLTEAVKQGWAVPEGTLDDVVSADDVERIVSERLNPEIVRRIAAAKSGSNVIFGRSDLESIAHGMFLERRKIAGSKLVPRTWVSSKHATTVKDRPKVAAAFLRASGVEGTLDLKRPQFVANPVQELKAA